MQLIIKIIQLLVSQTRYLNPQLTLKLRCRRLLEALVITPTQWLRILATSRGARSALRYHRIFHPLQVCRPMKRFSPSLQPHINQSPNPKMQQPQGYYASSNHAYSSNSPQSCSLPNPSWRGNSPHHRGYYSPPGVGFPSPQTHSCQKRKRRALGARAQRGAPIAPGGSLGAQMGFFVKTVLRRTRRAPRRSGAARRVEVEYPIDVDGSSDDFDDGLDD